jgi:hypothetical protein
MRWFQECFQGIEHEIKPNSSDSGAGGRILVGHHVSPAYALHGAWRRGSNAPLELTEAQAAPKYDAEEQNNIAIYKRVLPSVVNITSTTLVFDFFYGTCRSRGRARDSFSTRPATC